MTEDNPTDNKAGKPKARAKKTDIIEEGREEDSQERRSMTGENIKRPEGFNEAALSPPFDWGAPLRWRRTPAGLKTNVRWTVRHHSPDGLEIGDPGPGATDLALNILAALFPYEGGSFEQCFDGKVSHQAWKLHQDFKFEFLATADRDEGEVEWDLIETWLLERDIEVD